MEITATKSTGLAVSPQQFAEDEMGEAGRMHLYLALLEVSRIIASYHDFPSMLEALTVLLHTVAPFDYLCLMIYRPEDDSFQVIYPGVPSRPVMRSAGFGFEDGPGGWVWHNQKPLVCDIEEIEARFPKVLERRCVQQVVSCCTVPLTTSLHRVGALEFLSTHRGMYREEDVHFMGQVGQQVAVAVDNSLHHEAARVSNARLEMLLKVSNAVVSSLDMQELLEAVSGTFKEFLGAGFCSLVLHHPESGTLRWEAVCATQGTGAIQPGRVVALTDSPVAQAFRNCEPRMISFDELRELSAGSRHAAQLLEEGIKSVCLVPLIARGRAIGLLDVGHITKDTFDESEVRLLKDIATQVSISVDNARAYSEISQLKDKLSTEKLYLEEEIRTVYNMQEMVGESQALKHVLAQVETVAVSDATVLILGETGTGKEMVARAIHDQSRRHARTLVKLNCAAIPSGLLESDLFGHEKGAFTGAIAQKTGRFELASNGTLFLDEVGDLPLDLQPKLLRAVQEGEIERVGGTRPVKINIRLIAATHRNLDEMMLEGKFRRDLFYRLNVFPIVVPPLRERSEDIPLLVRHFASKYAKRMGKKIECIPTQTLQTLTHMPWPGNIRELENVIERAVITTQGTVLQVNFPESESARNKLTNRARFRVTSAPADSYLNEEDGLSGTIQEALRECNGRISGPNGAAERLGMSRSALLSAAQRLHISVYPQGVGSEERRMILQALRECNGMIAGDRGAAAKLGLNRTTLYSRMQRLGIRKND